MISKKYRLPLQSFFRRQPKRESRGRYFLYKFFPKEKSYPRFGVAVGKKIFPTATARNELRRIIYKTLQENFSTLNPENDVVIVATKKIGSTQEKHAMIDELLKILCSKQSS